MFARTILVIFFITAAVSPATIITSFSELCTAQDTRGATSFSELPSKTPLKWSVASAFAVGRYLGKGSFGEVHKVDYVDSAGHQLRIALKKIAPKYSSDKKQILTEISALAAVGQSAYMPRLYGCVTEGSSKVFLATSCLESSLESTSFLNKVKLQTCKESLQYYKEMFAGLKDLWTAGFVHNDIKPANMMADAGNKHVYLIDFGLAQLNTDYNKAMGTPIYMSPAKFKGSGKVAPKDDMYSVALSIATIEAPRTYDDIFSNGYSPMPFGCFERHNNVECRNVVRKNLIRVMKAAGYGDYVAANKDKINLTTLLADIVSYDHFSYSFDDVLEVIDRLMGVTEANKKLDEKQAAKLKEEVEKFDALRKGARDARRQEKVIKEEIALEDYDAKMLQNNNKGLPEDKNKIIQERMAKLEADKKAKEAKLNQIKVADNLQNNVLDKYEKRAREGSEVYQNNKNLFERKVVHDEPEQQQEEQQFVKPAQVGIQKSPTNVQDEEDQLGYYLAQKIKKAENKMKRNKNGMVPYYPGILNDVKKGLLREEEIDWHGTDEEKKAKGFDENGKIIQPAQPLRMVNKQQPAGNYRGGNNFNPEPQGYNINYKKKLNI